MSPTCPDDVVLRGLLDSSLPEPVQGEVVAHLDSCDRCQNALQQIAADGTSVLQAALEAKTVSEPNATSAFWPALERVESDVRASGVALAATRHDPARRTDPAVEHDFSFLEPSDE